VNDTNNKVAEANSKTQQLETEASKKIAQLATEAKAQLQLANQPEIPMSIEFRKASLYSGNVAMLTNTSNQTIAVTVNVSRTSSQNRSFDLTLDPKVKKEIGEREGWAFISGDTVLVKQEGHKSKTVIAP
jgi:hypothetical protein